MPRLRGAGGLAVVVLALLVLGGPANATSTSAERITSFDVELTVRADGDLAVREDIGYDFGAQDRHGILRTLRVRVPYDADNDRVYRVEDFRVASRTGAPSQVEHSESDGVATYRIGDPDRTISGRHDYTLTYVVRGALNAFADHDELYWNAIGDGWSVPIERARVVVRTPAPVTAQTCFAGPFGSNLPCGAAAVSPGGRTVTVDQPGGLDPYSALTVVVGMPKGTVPSVGPLLEERWTLRRALTPTPLTGGLAGLVLLPGMAGIGWLVATRGRDRRFVGLTPGLAPGVSTGGISASAADEPVPLAGAGPVAVQFQPPEGLRPGQVGTLLDEKANVVDVTATIVDLAVRGHLRIEELPRRGWFSSRDWRLVKLPGGRGELVPYEKLLYDGLFQDGDEVLLSSLKKTFAPRLAKVQSELYSDVTRAGWFRGRPDKVRGYWQAGGFVLALGGGWLTFALSQRLHWAPVGIAVTLVGVALFVLGSRMPARTARGSAVLAQVLGFREYIRTAEAEQLRFEEAADVFSRYLPFAVVFGEAERWVRVFGPLAATAAAGTAGATSPAWYSGPNGWDASSFGDSLSGFTSSAAGTLAASASSSSGGGSGFSGGSSGGGGGGGGGGSW